MPEFGPRYSSRLRIVILRIVSLSVLLFLQVCSAILLYIRGQERSKGLPTECKLGS
jgi:hypothetical protein